MKKQITTIVKKQDKCVVYNDDGIFCRWTPEKDFNFDLLKEIKENNDGIILLVSEEEAEKFLGIHYDYNDHPAWVLERWIIEMIYGTYPKDHWEAENEETKKLVRFLRTLQI